MVEILTPMHVVGQCLKAKRCEWAADLALLKVFAEFHKAFRDTASLAKAIDTVDTGHLSSICEFLSKLPPASNNLLRRRPRSRRSPLRTPSRRTTRT